MSVITRTTSAQPKIQIDASEITKAAELCLVPTQQRLPGRKPSTFSEIATKDLSKYFRIDCAAKLLVKESNSRGKQATNTDVDDSSLFIDTRKQEPFDWAKTTDAYQRIIHLSDLEDRWDGYDAPCFSREQIDLALTLYSKIRTYSIERGFILRRISPFIAPGSDGTILFEWAGKRFPVRQLEVYVPSTAADEFEYLKTEGDLEEESQFNLEGLYNILDWLLKFDAK